MIPRLVALALVGLSASSGAESSVVGDHPRAEALRPVPGAKQDDPAIERYRTPIEALTERMLGSASRAVRFDWRKKTVGVGAFASQLLELNNFASARAGAFARMPLGDLMVEVGFSRVFVWGSDSTDTLALTPYRQVGRPSRFELDINLGYPLAEGVVTPRLSFLSAAEFVFSVNLGLRYFFYADALKGANAGAVAAAILAPKLSDKELANMESLRMPGMQLDDNRYTPLVGFSLDVYFQPGLFISPRVMLALPVFSGLGGNDLKWWWELNLSLGWML